MGEPRCRVLRISEVLTRTGLNRAALYRKLANGTFPRQIQVSTRCVGWPESVVEMWIRNSIFFHVDNFR
jgi:prophage regulatory protein